MSLLTCGAGGALDASPPTNTVLPAITGTAQQGQVLTCSTGSWTGSPTSYTYQWTNSSTGNIGGATSSTYTAQSSDVGDTLTCTVAAHNTSGATPATSAATSTVLPPAPAFSSAAVSANGSTFTITFTHTITSGSSGLTFKDGSSTYTLTYVSGIGTATLTYMIGTTVYSGDTCTVAYTAGNIAGSGGSVANFTAQSVTNNSNQYVPAALIAHAIASTATGSSTAGPVNTTGANFLCAQALTTSGFPSISDNYSNVWTQIAGSTAIAYWYCANPIVGTGHTVTVTDTGGNPVLGVMAFSNMSATPFANETTFADFAGSQPGALTPGKANEVVIAMCSVYPNAPTGIDSGFVFLDSQHQISPGTNGVSNAYLIQTSIVTVNPTWTFSGTALHTQQSAFRSLASQ